MEEQRNFLLDKRWFIDSRHGNIKEEYKFVKKLGRGGYGTVYMAERKSTGMFNFNSR
jgi:serine/threonine protein kinase